MGVDQGKDALREAPGTGTAAGQKQTSKEPLRFVRPPVFRRTFRFRFAPARSLWTGSAYRAPWRVSIISQVVEDVKCATTLLEER